LALMMEAIADQVHLLDLLTSMKLFVTLVAILILFVDKQI